MKKQVLLIAMAMLAMTTLGQSFILPLWEGDPPNYKETGEATIWDTTDIVRVHNIQKPDIAVFLPSKAHATGEAVLVCPGGGYYVLAYDWEGNDIARWLNSKGIAAFVLKYRLPGSSNNIVPHKSPLMDAQRAMRLIRFRAADWNLDPNRIGVMGFSAGGHLASTLSTHFDGGDPGAGDPVESMSCRPDFSILMYPVITFSEDFTHRGTRDNLLGKEADPDLVRYYSNELMVSADTPPTILIHSGDDKAVPIENSLTYYAALRDKGVEAELHVYPYGGHGYSLAIGRGYLSTWPDRVIEWLHRAP